MHWAHRGARTPQARARASTRPNDPHRMDRATLRQGVAPTPFRPPPSPPPLAITKPSRAAAIAATRAMDALRGI